MAYILISCLILPLIIILGIKTTKSDLNDKKIYNKDIIFFLEIGGALQLCIIVLTLFAKPDGIPESLSAFILVKILINFLLTFITGFLIWSFKWWAAGDVKLISVFALLMPLSYYTSSANKIFPFFDCYINTYTFATIFILIEIFLDLRTKLKDIKWPELKKVTGENFIKIGRIIFNMLFMILMISKVRELLTNYLSDLFKFDMMYVYVVMFIAFSSINRFLQNKIVFYVSASGMLAYILYNIFRVNYSFLKDLTSFLSIGFGIAMFSMLLNAYLEKIDTKEVAISKLKKHMIPAQRSLVELVKVDELRDAMKNMTHDGLSLEDISQIKKYSDHKVILIENTFPFAPFIFAGTLLTAILQDNLLLMFFRLFR